MDPHRSCAVSGLEGACHSQDMANPGPSPSALTDRSIEGWVWCSIGISPGCGGRWVMGWYLRASCPVAGTQCVPVVMAEMHEVRTYAVTSSGDFVTSGKVPH